MSENKKDDKIPDYDEEEVFDEKFAPLIDQLIELAQEHDIPLHVTVQFACNDGTGKNCTTHIPGKRATKQFMYLASFTAGAEGARRALIESLMAGVSGRVIAISSDDLSEESTPAGFPLRSKKGSVH